ncbi:MAG: hypothetical protein AAGA48_28560 [Myxococcota bacterium]
MMHVPWWLIGATAGCSDANLAVADYPTSAAEPSSPTGPPVGDSDDPMKPPPEDEAILGSLPPSQTDAYVFVPNPDRNTVTRIRVDTLSVDTTPVGSDPQIVQTTRDYTTAVVFNRGEDSVSILDAETLDQRKVQVRDNFNDMRLAPDGEWAVLWHNRANERPDDPPVEGLQSFNETSFVHLPTGTHAPMAVGFNPRMVVFTPDGALAVVVADAYLATVDLTVTEPSPVLIELEADVQAAPRAEEVILASDGSFAWVRQFGATELLVVDLVSGAIETVPAGANPTDLDLSADGTEAIALARGSQELWVYQADDPGLLPRVVPLPGGGNYGSLVVDPNDSRGLLYTTASLQERYAVWDRATDEVQERPLVKPVDGIAINPTGETALVFHSIDDGPETEPLFAGSWAMTMVSLADLRTNPLKLPAEPTAFANSGDGAFGFFIMEDEPLLEVLDYSTLLHTERELRSVPEFLGVLPDLDALDADAPAAWVSQEHPLGRISFYDADDDTLETLTGFELNSEIE